VTVTVTRNTICDRVLRRQRMQLFEWHRVALTECRIDIRWLSGRGMTPTSCVIPVSSVAVMENSCDACGDGEYYFRSSSSAEEDASV
jgi:hypothetical protein